MELGQELRVSLRLDRLRNMYAEVFLPTCEKHENIYIIMQRERSDG